MNIWSYWKIWIRIHLSHHRIKWSLLHFLKFIQFRGVGCSGQNVSSWLREIISWHLFVTANQSFSVYICHEQHICHEINPSDTKLRPEVKSSRSYISPPVHYWPYQLLIDDHTFCSLIVFFLFDLEKNCYELFEEFFLTWVYDKPLISQ